MQETRTATSLALLVRQVEHQLEDRIARGVAPLLAEHDLTPERCRVLAALAVEPGQTMTQLAQASVLPPASLTRHVDRLVSRGLVLRTTYPGDRRRVVAALTDRGHQVHGLVREREREVQEELRRALGEQRFDTLVSELQLVGLALSD